MIYEKAPIANIATSTIISNGLSKKLGSVVAQEQACGVSAVVSVLFYDCYALFVACM